MTKFPEEEMRKESEKYAFSGDNIGPEDYFEKGARWSWNKAQDIIDDAKFVPGNFRCAKCDFYLVATNLYVKTGATGANNSPQECPNGCGPLWRVTHTQRLNSVLETANEATIRVKTAEMKLKIALAALDQARKIALEVEQPHKFGDGPNRVRRMLYVICEALETFGDLK